MNNKCCKYAPNSIDSEADYIFQSWPQKYFQSHILFFSVTLPLPMRRESAFPALETELALVSGWKSVGWNRTDDMRFPRGLVMWSLAVYSLFSLNVFSLDSPHQGSPSQNPAECHAMKRSDSWRAMCGSLGH